MPPPDVAKVTPEKPKPPIVLSARVIESWLARYPQALAVKTEVAAAKAPPAMKYEMERAVCEERVVVHQDPTDPAKSPRGLVIAGGKLNLTATRVNGEVGQIMTVTAAPNQIAQVHFETLSLFGPTIKIDQVSNTVAIDGIGSMLMPSTSDFSGTPTDGVNELEIRWKRSMFFNGAKGSAEFLEQVNATQSPAREGLVPRPEKAPAPRTLPVSVKLDEKAGDGGSWGRTRVLCHRMDVTFDRPIYFNQFRRDASAGAAKDPQESPKLKTALCVPIPDDELTPQTNPLTRKVTFTEESYTRANRPLKFQRIECQQLEVRLREKSQEMFATGPGEVRFLQPDSSEWGKPTPPPTPAVAKKSGEAAPFKLTLVKYTNRMVAVDKNKLFQSATFADGANAWQIPTNDINLKFLAHQAPEGTTTLSCSQSLEVSSSRPRPDAEAELSMVALGNAEFSNDDYDGLATRITYDSKLVTLYGTSERLASIYRRKRSLNEPQALRARTIKYPKYGTISADEAGTGVFTP